MLWQIFSLVEYNTQILATVKASMTLMGRPINYCNLPELISPPPTHPTHTSHPFSSLSFYAHAGKTTISNDGATIMKLLDIVHPAAKTLVDISLSQDAEVCGPIGDVVNIIQLGVISSMEVT